MRKQEPEASSWHGSSMQSSGLCDGSTATKPQRPQQPPERGNGTAKNDACIIPNGQRSGIRLPTPRNVPPQQAGERPAIWDTSSGQAP